MIAPKKFCGENYLELFKISTR